MQTNPRFHVLAAITALALVIPAIPASANILYQASIDTSSLIGNPAGPFYLDFQFNDGDGTGDGNNTVSLSNFAFGGGSPFGAATTFGGVSGDLLLGIDFAETSAFNEFYQGFTPGNTLDFVLSMTTNVDGGGTPDFFGFAILDGNLTNISTTDPTGQFIVINVDSASPPVQTFASDDPRASIPVPTVAVPEPTSAMLLLGAAAMLLLRRRRG